MLYRATCTPKLFTCNNDTHDTTVHAAQSNMHPLLLICSKDTHDTTVHAAQSNMHPLAIDLQQGHTWHNSARCTEQHAPLSCWLATRTHRVSPPELPPRSSGQPSTLRVGGPRFTLLSTHIKKIESGMGCPHWPTAMQSSATKTSMILLSWARRSQWEWTGR